MFLKVIPAVDRKCKGFTLAELMVVVAMIGILSGIAIVFSGNEWRRERINAVALDFAGWLEQIRSASLRQIDADPSLGGCVITVNAISSVSPGSATPLASVQPTRCSPTPSFGIPGTFSQSTSYSSNLSNAATITFTPRGSVILSSNSSPAVVRVFLEGSSLVRCIRVSEGLGIIRIGSFSAASSAADDCTSYAGF